MNLSTDSYPARPAVSPGLASPPLRVLMVRVGGWDSWVDTVAQHLAREGLGVTALVLAMDVTPRSTVVDTGLYTRREERIAPSRLGKPGDLLRAGLRLRQCLREQKFDILYVVDSWTLPSLWIATSSRFRYSDRAFVYHTFEWLEPGVHNRLHIRLERKACRMADLVINIDRMRGRLQKMLYRLPQCPLWIRNSLPSAYQLPDKDLSLRQELLGKQPPPDALAVFSPSVTSSERLTLEQIRAFSLLPERYRLSTIAGKGDYFVRCQEEVRSLGLSDRVVFLPRMPFGRLMQYVVCADIGTIFHDGQISSGNYMANPMRVSQFAASGIPFVASAFPTLEAEVYRYGLGLCCDENDPAAIAGAIRSLGEGSPSLTERKEHVRRVFETELNFESRGGHLVDALRNLARRRQAEVGQAT